MKTLGLLGGMSWESTAVYYRELNRLARERRGGLHSASLLLWSADFAPIARMQSDGDWASATRLLGAAARRLEDAGAEGLLICANTMHLLADEVQAEVSVPLIHIAEATAGELTRVRACRPLLLATRFTMEGAFYRDRLSAGGLSPVIPREAERRRLHAIIYDELVQGRIEPASRAEVAAIAARAIATDGVDAVVLACTEFGLLVGPDDFAAPVIDSTLAHVKAAADFAFPA